MSNSDKGEIQNPDGTRKFLNDALKEFRTKLDPDDRLRSLWKISQLVDNTTDEELYELAAAAAVEEDHRLREDRGRYGRLCRPEPETAGLPARRAARDGTRQGREVAEIQGWRAV